MNTPQEKVIRYAGFWIRFLATLIDCVLFMLITLPLMWMVYGATYFIGSQMYHGWVDLGVNYVLPIFLTILFWLNFRGTPGKKWLGLAVVDAQTFSALSLRQSLIRYLAYLPMIIPFCLGFLSIAWHSKKQGWHDRWAGSVVIFDN